MYVDMSVDEEGFNVSVMLRRLFRSEIGVAETPQRRSILSQGVLDRVARDSYNVVVQSTALHHCSRLCDELLAHCLNTTPGLWQFRADPPDARRKAQQTSA